MRTMRIFKEGVISCLANHLRIVNASSEMKADIGHARLRGVRSKNDGKTWSCMISGLNATQQAEVGIKGKYLRGPARETAEEAAKDHDRCVERDRSPPPWLR